AGAASGAGMTAAGALLRVLVVEDQKFFFSSRRRHTRSDRDWSSDVCSSDLTTPVEAVIAAVRERGLEDDKAHRLIGRLWALERMFYYIYGGWGQGLEMNDFPPSVKYLFARQIVDESTHEMLYMDALLRQGCVATQKEAFRHPYGQFAVDSAVAYYVFSLRNLATYPHPIRIAALNLGPKVIELAWMEALAEAIADPDIKHTFTSQSVENKSHIAMGRRVVEEFVEKPVEME